MCYTFAKFTYDLCFLIPVGQSPGLPWTGAGIHLPLKRDVLKKLMYFNHKNNEVF